MRRKLLSALALVSTIWAILWAFALLRWRAGDRIPAGNELALQLLALPLAATGLVGLAYAGMRRLRTIPGAHEAARGMPAARETQVPQAAEAAWLPLLDAQVLMPAGDAPEDVLQAARQGQRPRLHTALRDALHRPVLAAGVKGLDPDDLAWPAPMSAWPAPRRRVFALVERLALRTLEANSAILRSAAGRQAGPTPSAVARIEWWLPKGWLGDDAPACSTWLAEKLEASGWRRGEVPIEVFEADGELPAWRRLDALSRDALRSADALPRLVIAGASHVDQVQVSAWERAGALYAPSTPEGRVPGEGAASILVIPPGTLDRISTPVRLSRPFLKPRGRRVDAPQRLQSDVLMALAEEASTRDGRARGAPLALFSDTDIRSSRCAEALHFAAALQPDEDPMTSLYRVGVANGDCGMALCLAVIAAAMRHCVTRGQPCLVFSNGAPTLRAVMLLSPSPSVGPADRGTEGT
ncbi:MAG TPA: hypothetical protein VF265_08275 [Nevskiaceae bacterium]